MTTLNIRIDEKLKKEAREVLEKQGLDLSHGVKLFLNQVVFDQGIPFQPTLRSDCKLCQKRDHSKLREKIEQWDKESEDTMRHQKQFKNAREAIEDLLGN